MKTPLLWLPGPTHVRPEILSELERPPIGHRSAAMGELIERIDPGLFLAFGTDGESGSRVGVGTHSATAMMEGALRGAGPRILAVVNGAFSKRWSEIAATIGKEVTLLELPWGRGPGPEELAAALEGGGPFDALTLVVCETSTGVLTPMEPLRAVLAAHPETLLLVDVVSAIAGVPIDFDRNGIDLALAGVNKALALPPGITVLCASARYLERARERERRTWYLDPVRLLDGHAARKTPTTPCIPLYRALARQLEDISAGVALRGDAPAGAREAWDARFAEHALMRGRTLQWAAGRGLEPFPAPEISSATVTCLRAGSLDVPHLLAELKRRGHEVGGGYGPLKGETFRIGHMGDHNLDELEDLLAAADEILA